MHGDKRLLDCKPVDRRFSKGVTGPQTCHPSDDSETAAKRLAIQIELKNWPRCHEIIDRLEFGEDMNDTPTEEELLATPLATILQVRTANYLEEIGVFTLGDALQQDSERLLELPNFGPACLAELKAAANKVLGRDAA